MLDSNRSVNWSGPCSQWLDCFDRRDDHTRRAEPWPAFVGFHDLCRHWPVYGMTELLWMKKGTLERLVSNAERQEKMAISRRIFYWIPR